MIKEIFNNTCVSFTCKYNLQKSNTTTVVPFLCEEVIQVWYGYLFHLPSFIFVTKTNNQKQFKHTKQTIIYL